MDIIFALTKKLDTMTNSDFTITITINSKKSAQEIFDTILDVRSWWSGLFGEEFTGSSESVGDVFTFTAGEGAHYTEQQLVELIPEKKIVWLVTESRLTFLEKVDEWKGSKLIFELDKQTEGVQVKFTHEGLTVQSECYDNCAPAWTQYILTKLEPLLKN